MAVQLHADTQRQWAGHETCPTALYFPQPVGKRKQCGYARPSGPPPPLQLLVLSSQLHRERESSVLQQPLLVKEHVPLGEDGCLLRAAIPRLGWFGSEHGRGV